MLTEKLAGIPVISKVAVIFGVMMAALIGKNKARVQKLISKTVDEFLPALKVRTPTIMDRTIVVVARTV
jgi:hypothetical protein